MRYFICRVVKVPAISWNLNWTEFQFYRKFINRRWTMNWEVPPLPPIFWNWKWTKFYFKRNFYNPVYLKDPTTTSNQEKHPLSGDPPPQQTGWQSTCTPRRWRRTTSPGTTCWPGSTSRSTPVSPRSRRCAAAPRIASSWTCSFPVSDPTIYLTAFIICMYIVKCNHVPV